MKTGTYRARWIPERQFTEPDVVICAGQFMPVGSRSTLGSQERDVCVVDDRPANAALTLLRAVPCAWNVGLVSGRWLPRGGVCGEDCCAAERRGQGPAGVRVWCSGCGTGKKPSNSKKDGDCAYWEVAEQRPQPPAMPEYGHDTHVFGAEEPLEPPQTRRRWGMLEVAPWVQPVPLPGSESASLSRSRAA